MKSLNIEIDRLTSKLVVEAEKLRKAAIKKDIKEVDEITHRKEQILKQIRLLIKNRDEEKGN